MYLVVINMGMGMGVILFILWNILKVRFKNLIIHGGKADNLVVIA